MVKAFSLRSGLWKSIYWQRVDRADLFRVLLPSRSHSYVHLSRFGAGRISRRVLVSGDWLCLDECTCDCGVTDRLVGASPVASI